MTQWFKFYGADYLIDPKIKGLTACERSCLITLLCYASTAEIPGEIKYLKEYQLMVDAGLDPMEEEWDKTKGVLQRLKDLEVIKLDDNGLITVINFRKRQDTALTNYERVKKYRERKRIDNADVTNDNARVEENRKEENRITQSGGKPPTPAEQAREFFNKPEKQLEVLLALQNKYGQKDLLSAELKKFIEYWTELNKSGTKQRWEQQLTFEVKRRLATWLNNIKNFNKPARTNAIKI